MSRAKLHNKYELGQDIAGSLHMNDRKAAS